MEKIKPIRIQRKRSKGFNLEAESRFKNGLKVVYVGRPTKWGNPFSLKSAICEAARELGKVEMKYKDPIYEGATDLMNYARELAIRNYKTYLERNPELIEAAQRDLKGKNLACWCKEGSPCHADVLLELANNPSLLNTENK